ncbi:MAG: hypothetical protein ACE5J2_07595, partial [Nitrososphaerales archaeon]
MGTGTWGRNRNYQVTTRSLIGRKYFVVLSALLVFSIISLPSIMPVLPAYADAKLFSASISPTTGATSENDVTYTITVTNSLANGQGAKMGCAEIIVPDGYTDIQAPNITVLPSGLSWSASVSGSTGPATITVNADTNAAGNKILPVVSDNFVTFTIQVDNPPTPDSYEWTTTVTGNNNCGSDPFEIEGSQPTVTTTTPTTTTTTTPTTTTTTTTTPTTTTTTTTTPTTTTTTTTTPTTTTTTTPTTTTTTT